MTKRLERTASLLLALFVVSGSADVSARGDETDAVALATKILDQGAAEFSRKNAGVMAMSFTEDAVFRFVTRDGDGLKTESGTGRTEIEGYYKKLFDNDQTIIAKNTVMQARFLAKDLLLVSGSFQPDTNQPKLVVQFVQIRKKVGEHWLIRDMQVFYLPEE
ncbi:MAG: hypothetical protein SFX72_01460 [Isosphaeraceae bacterium]|nr:hypothetical protein [Isosphaeraceae bacterium]